VDARGARGVRSWRRRIWAELGGCVGPGAHPNAPTDKVARSKVRKIEGRHLFAERSEAPGRKLRLRASFYFILCIRGRSSNWLVSSTSRLLYVPRSICYSSQCPLCTVLPRCTRLAREEIRDRVKADRRSCKVHAFLFISEGDDSHHRHENLVGISGKSNDTFFGASKAMITRTLVSCCYIFISSSKPHVVISN